MKLTTIDKVVMRTGGGLLDLVQALLGILLVGVIVNTVMTLLGLISIGFYCLLRGIPLVTRRTLKRFGAGAVVEVIPIINLLPAWSLAIHLMIRGIDQEEAARQEATRGDTKANLEFRRGQVMVANQQNEEFVYQQRQNQVAGIMTEAIVENSINEEREAQILDMQNERKNKKPVDGIRSSQERQYANAA
jgi:hypothetical protein